jgi:hypothetical protein
MTDERGPHGDPTPAKPDLDKKIQQYSSVIKKRQASPRQKANALINRGLAYSQRAQEGDRERELADYAAVIEMPEAPAEQKAKAFLYRGITYGERAQAGESNRELAD